MKNFLVTVRLPKNPEHNPRDKKTGPCPLNGLPCTDVTGEHHTFLVEGTSAEEVREVYETLALYRVTRVETVG